ncbi:MAG TPA: MOSC N-terminal beta barrel domain-containing protein [Nocardioidaceae bacterium]|nr:MOSC N-terminal beta barrel domain-containing protein [Nocardioidaceae bacterium]
MVGQVRVASLHRYVVKSLTGVDVTVLDIEPWGPRGDRRWAVVDPAGRKVTARELHAMLSLRAEALADGAVRIAADAGGTLDVPAPRHGPAVAVDFSRQPTAVYAGDDAAGFLTAALGRPLRLVWQPDPRERAVSAAKGGRAGEALSLADAGPLLLTTRESLGRLQEWVGSEPVLAMRRFRPNVVVAGAAPFAEDGWATVRLGEVDFRVLEPCGRCVLTMVDPDTLRTGPEPVRTLARHRRRGSMVYFGVRLVPISTGRVAVGDAVYPSAR